MVFDRFCSALMGYISVCFYIFVCVCVCVQNIGDSSRTKSVKMRQRGITTIWGGWRKNEGSGTHAHIQSEDEQSAVLFFLEIVPNQPEKEATTRRTLLHFFSILHLFLVSLSPSLIFPSCRFHHLLDRQRTARSRRMMMMTTSSTTMPLSVTTRRTSSSDDDDAKRIPSYIRAIERWFANALTYSRSFCAIDNRANNDDFQIIWFFVLIHCVLSLLYVYVYVHTRMQSVCKRSNASKQGNTLTNACGHSSLFNPLPIPH
jgi:hypothetical protein